MSDNIVICGSFGFGNAGDEAVPLAIGDLCDAIGWKPGIVCVSRYDTPALPDVIGLNERYAEERRQQQGVPLLFSGGGIVENAAKGTILKCAPLITELNPSSVWLYAGSVEFGVRYSWPIKRRLRAILGTFNGIYVRDVLSAEALSDIAPNAQIQTIGDSVLGMLPSDGGVPFPFGSEPYIAVCLSPRWKDNREWTEWIVRELTDLARKEQIRLVYVPMTGNYDDDREEHNRIATVIAEQAPDISQHVIMDTLRPRQISSILGNAELTIGMRLHACILSYSQRTPCVGISYHPKLFGFARTMDIDDYFLPVAASHEQHNGTYGYHFSPALYDAGALVDKSISAMKHFPFHMLSVYRTRLSAALSLIHS